MLALYVVVIAIISLFVFGLHAHDKALAVEACREAIYDNAPGIVRDDLTASARIADGAYRVEFVASMRGRLMTWGCRARRMPDGSWAAAPE
jgi:hypothetical protein